MRGYVESWCWLTAAYLAMSAIDGAMTGSFTGDMADGALTSFHFAVALWYHWR